MQLSRLIAGMLPRVRTLLLDFLLLNHVRINQGPFERKLIQNIEIKTEVNGKAQVIIC